jgi:hypothetical protein
MEDANFCSKQGGEWHSPGAIWAAQLFAPNKKPSDAQYQFRVLLVDAYLNYACALGCNGIVSKRVGSPYRAGRSKHWIKVKNPAELP